MCPFHIKGNLKITILCLLSIVLFITIPIGHIYTSAFPVYQSTFSKEGMKSVFPENLFTIDDSCSDAQLKNIEVQYKLVPHHIIESMINDEFEIIVQTEDIKSQYDFDVIGLSVWDEKKIYIDARSQFNNFTLIHEIGHYVDRGLANNFATSSKTMFSSNSDEFQTAYKKEKQKIKSEYGEYYGSNEKEFFAAIFTQIILENNDIQSIAPKSCVFVKKIMDTY